MFSIYFRIFNLITKSYDIDEGKLLFDDIDMNKFAYEKKIVPEMYKEVESI